MSNNFFKIQQSNSISPIQKITLSLQEKQCLTTVNRIPVILRSLYGGYVQSSLACGIESAFRFFDGVPREIVCDNAKPLVKDHMRRRTSVLQPALTGSASIMACIP